MYIHHIMPILMADFNRVYERQRMLDMCKETPPRANLTDLVEWPPSFQTYDEYRRELDGLIRQEPRFRTWLCDH